MNKIYQLFSKILPLIFLMTVTVFQNSQAQTLPPNFLWAVSGGGNGYDEAADVTVDNQDNVIVTGDFDSTATFGGFVLTPTGSRDIFLVKYTSGGNAVWAVRAGGDSYNSPYSLTTDHQGNIILTGVFSGTCIFGAYTLVSYGGYDVFTAKYSTDGVCLWAQQGGGQNSDYGYSVAADNQDNIIVTGTFQQFAQFGDFTVQSGNPYGDIFVVKYDPAGNVLWLKAAINPTGGITFNNVSYGTRTDNNNNVFITGSFSGVIQFGDTTLVSSWDGTNQDVFLAKYDTQGTFVWATQVGSDSSGGYFYGHDIKIDKDNNILFTGTFNGQAVFNGIVITGFENADIFIAKYNQSAVPVWVIQDHGSPVYNDSRKMDLDAAGNISLIASITQSVSSETNDVYFARYTNTGQKLWGIRAGQINSNNAGGLADDSKGDIYGCGSFYFSGLFGTITLNGIWSDAFIAKLPSPKFSISPPQVNFGSVPIFSFDSASVSLTNTSTANLHIFSMTLFNDTSSSFGILSGYPLDSISAQQTANMEIAFFPVYSGVKNAYIEIISDASTSPDTILITGTAVQSSILLSDTLLNFGSVDAGITSSLNLSLGNESPVNIIVDSVKIRGGDASNFSFSPNVDGDTLIYFSFINLTVSFSPDTSGLKTAYLVIYSSAGNSPDSVRLTGTGLTTIQVQLPSANVIGQSTAMNITPPSAILYTLSQIFYRKTGDVAFQQDTLSRQGNIYTYNIPASYSTITGIQFYLMFSDGIAVITYPSNTPQTRPASIQLGIPQMNYFNPIRAGQYQMISIPLSIASPQIDAVFQDDYGSYNQQIWRIFRWQPGANSYAEHNAIPGDVVPGNAYWLINRDGKIFDINNSLSVPSFNNYTITLQPGYNQIGDPFAFPIDWALIENTDSLLQLPIGWNSDSLDYDISTLLPWEGYWVYNQLGHSLNININPNTSLEKKQSVNMFASMKSDEFLVQLKASLNSSGAKDLQNYIGMMEDAGNTANRYNVIKPPAIDNRVQLLLSSGGIYYARNVVPVSKDGAYWDFTVESSSPNQPLTLAVEKKSALPDNFNIWLLDKDREIPVNISDGTAQTVTLENGKVNFRIIIGTEDFAKLHSDNISLQAFDYALYQNYPNPFNPATTITWQLKEKSNVTLEIYDILGERVMSIVNNVVQDPGQHYAVWDGRNASGEKVASGIYIYRLRAKDFISSKKMILLK